MTDTSPLLKIKEALGSIKAEIKAMELRIGVVGHTIMQSKIRYELVVLLLLPLLHVCGVGELVAVSYVPAR